jgi:hypothetical protein
MAPIYAFAPTNFTLSITQARSYQDQLGILERFIGLHTSISHHSGTGIHEEFPSSLVQRCILHNTEDPINMCPLRVHNDSSHQVPLFSTVP